MQTRSLPAVIPSTLGRPHIIFFCELEGPALLELLATPGLLDFLAAGEYGVAVALHNLSVETAQAIATLNQRRIPVVAWLLLPAEEGFWFNLQNYPQAIERYRAARRWAIAHKLHFQAIGLDIEPPLGEVIASRRRGIRDIARRIWLAHENVLYESARAAYVDLIAEVHHDGYEVHTYQLPLIVDDRRAATTTIQRALDIIDLPADVEVLLCFSSIPIEKLGNDLGGALIDSYGPAADAIGVGCIVGSAVRSSSAEDLPPLAWDALERDLQLAAHHTDTIYLFSLEGCVEHGLLPRLNQIDWTATPRPDLTKRLVIQSLRTVLLIVMLMMRFSRPLLAWSGWIVAAFLFFRLRQQKRYDNHRTH
ncbi:hypothetical protein [Chloroflexus sp.]|uniref:hypothetical protein n=1 Tax=Chloroflexus sp. TaxID=1904827 RepID=UPI002ACEE2CE|nr:hypothetical protein [Chloroflexus sp.]